jgi:hypothetical protein
MCKIVITLMAILYACTTTAYAYYSDVTNYVACYDLQQLARNSNGDYRNGVVSIHEVVRAHELNHECWTIVHAEIVEACRMLPRANTKEDGHLIIMTRGERSEIVKGLEEARGGLVYAQSIFRKDAF